jgi:hypothetical protein
MTAPGTSRCRRAADSIKATNRGSRPEISSGFSAIGHIIKSDNHLGIVLHLGAESIPLGERISAVPLAALWESG